MHDDYFCLKLDILDDELDDIMRMEKGRKDFLTVDSKYNMITMMIMMAMIDCMNLQKSKPDVASHALHYHLQ